jgi:hypothetical protein
MEKNKKYPDNIVYNYETNEFDANTKSYPTTIGSQNFDIVEVDRSESFKADKFFKKRLDEIKKEYESLTKIYESTRLVYDTKYSFQPDLGVVYHMYIGNDGETFLSIIDPNQWDREYLGSFVLHANGTWEKVDYHD